MRILTSENVPYDIDRLPDDIDTDVRYCVLDYSNQNDVDYYFVPLLFMESFNSPVALLQINNYQVRVPLDWSIMVGDKHLGDLELLEISKHNDRDFTAFVFNPISGYAPGFHDIRILEIFPDVKWFFPKLKFGHILTIPMGEYEKDWPVVRSTGKRAPDCVYIVRDVNKLPDALDISKMF